MEGGTLVCHLVVRRFCRMVHPHRGSFFFFCSCVCARVFLFVRQCPFFSPWSHTCCQLRGCPGSSSKSGDLGGFWVLGFAWGSGFRFEGLGFLGFEGLGFGGGSGGVGGEGLGGGGRGFWCFGWLRVLGLEVCFFVLDLRNGGL